MKNYLGMLALCTLMACTNTANKDAEKKDSTNVANVAQTANQPSFKDSKVAGIYTDYLKLKDALVATQVADAKNAAQNLATALKGYNGCENTSLIAQKIADAKDIAAQRKEFTALSTDLIALFKHADLISGTIYIQHCPMANKGDGGDWLAAEKKIQNPYYGSEMMECGSVVEEIKAK